MYNCHAERYKQASRHQVLSTGQCLFVATQIIGGGMEKIQLPYLNEA